MGSRAFCRSARPTVVQRGRLGIGFQALPENDLCIHFLAGGPVYIRDIHVGGDEQRIDANAC